MESRGSVSRPPAASLERGHAGYVKAHVYVLVHSPGYAGYAVVFALEMSFDPERAHTGLESVLGITAWT